MPKKSPILKRSGNPSVAAKEVVSIPLGNKEQTSATSPILSVEKLETGSQKGNINNDTIQKQKDPDSESVSVGVEVRPKARRKPTEQKGCSQNSTTGTMAGRSYVACCRCEPNPYRAPTPRLYKPSWDASPRVNNFRKPSASNVKCCCPMCTCCARRSIRNGYDSNSNICPCCKSSNSRKTTVERFNLKVQTSCSVLQNSKDKCSDTPENPLSSLQNMGDEDWNFCFGNPETSQGCNLQSAPNPIANPSGAVTPDVPQLRCAQQLLVKAQKLLMGAANKLLVEGLSGGTEVTTCDANIEALGRISELFSNINQLPTFNKGTPVSTRSPSPNINQLPNEGNWQQKQRGPGQDVDEFYVQQFNSANGNMNAGGVFQKTPSAPFDTGYESQEATWAGLNQSQAPQSFVPAFNRASSPVQFPAQQFYQQTNKSPYASANSYKPISENFQDPSQKLKPAQTNFVPQLSAMRELTFNRNDFQYPVPVQQQDERQGPIGFWESRNVPVPQPQLPMETRQVQELRAQAAPGMQQFFGQDGQAYWGKNDDNPQRSNDKQQPQRPNQGYWNSTNENRALSPMQFKEQKCRIPGDGGYELVPTNNQPWPGGIKQDDWHGDRTYMRTSIETSPYPEVPDMQQVQQVVGQGYGRTSVDNAPQLFYDTPQQQQQQTQRQNQQQALLQFQQQQQQPQLQELQPQQQRQRIQEQPQVQLRNQQQQEQLQQKCQDFLKPPKGYGMQQQTRQEPGTMNSDYWSSTYENPNLVAPARIDMAKLAYKNNNVNPACFDYPENAYPNQSLAQAPEFYQNQLSQNSCQNPPNQRFYQSQCNPPDLNTPTFETTSNIRNQQRMFQDQSTNYSPRNQQNSLNLRDRYQDSALDQEFMGMYPPNRPSGIFTVERPLTVIISQSNSAQDNCANPDTRQGYLAATPYNRNPITQTQVMGTSFYDDDCSDESGPQSPGLYRQGNQPSPNPGYTAENQHQFLDPTKNNPSAGIGRNLVQPQQQPQTTNPKPQQSQPSNGNSKTQPVRTKSQQELQNTVDSNIKSPYVQSNYYRPNSIPSGKIGQNGVAGGNGSNSLQGPGLNRNDSGLNGMTPVIDARKNKPGMRASISTNPCIRCAPVTNCNSSSSQRPIQLNRDEPCGPGSNQQGSRSPFQRKQEQGGRLARQDSISGLRGIIGVTPLTTNPLGLRDGRCI